jgi:hypothetical protein
MTIICSMTRHGGWWKARCRALSLVELGSRNLGLTFCREGTERPVSQFQVLKYPPSIAPRAVGIRLNIDAEFGGIHHYQNHRSAISYASSPSKPRATPARSQLRCQRGDTASLIAS